MADSEPIVQRQSQYQLIEVHRNQYYGKILVLDGVVQLTEKDADSYNEMLTHVPMFAHPNPKRVLVIGGGDGYVLSEVLKHDSVEHVDHVDLDEAVIETCREHFSWGSAWEDPRVRLHVADGAAFVRNADSGFYDVIIQDSSDPSADDEDGNEIILPSAVLYSSEHFKHLHRILKPGGILNIQAECLQIPADLDGIVTWRTRALSLGFSTAKYGSIMISSYPTGQIGFLLCEKGPASSDSAGSIRDRFIRMCDSGNKTSYYHPALQKSSFDLPLWAEEKIYGNSICRNQDEEARDS